MRDQSFPPSAEDWVSWLHIDKKEIPFNIALEGIVDPILRGETQIFQGVTDQATREKAIAKFYDYVGADSLDIQIVFNRWSQRSTVECIQRECIAKKMEVKHGLDILRVTLAALDLIGKGAIEKLADDAPVSLSGRKLPPSEPAPPASA